MHSSHVQNTSFTCFLGHFYIPPVIDSGTDNFKTGQFNDIIIHEGRFVQIPGFKITSIFHILPYYPLCDARYAPGQSETDFSTISQSDYVLQQWRCNKWRSKYPSELVSYERTVWPITISRGVRGGLKLK